MKRSSSELPMLIGQLGPLNGQRWLIRRDLIIGRDDTCDIVIPARQVSRYHARLEPVNDGIKLVDLSSKNGTFCNGKRVDEYMILQDGDILQIALIQGFAFYSSDATLPLEFDTQEEKTGTYRLLLDQRSRRVYIGEQEVLPPLSGPQFRLLQTLFESQGRVVPRQDLILAVWEEDEAIGISEQALDALVRRLRDRLVELDPDHSYIITVRGHGLRLDNPSDR